MDQPAATNSEADARDHLRLFTGNRAGLIRYAAVFTGDVGVAEDVVQDAWSRYMAAAGTRTIHEPERFLFRIVRNLALDARRRRALENRLFAQDAAEAVQQIAHDAPSAHAQTESAQELAQVLDAVSRLPERTRRAFLMNRVEGMTLVETGKRLGVSKSVVHELVVSALAHCRSVLRRGT